MRNIITGINANDDVNVDDLFTVGNSTVQTMEGQSIFSYSHKRNTRVKTLATARAIKVTEDRTIDPALLFQRFLVVSQSGDLSLSEVMDYELCPYPPSLFEAKDCFRKPDKAQLVNHVTPTSGIKDNTHQRRGANKTANKVNISDATKFVGKKEDFLSNSENKQAMIDLIAKCLQQKGCHVIQAEGDADVDIVKAAVSMCEYKSTTLIGEDTDLLILLLHHATLKDSHELYFRFKPGIKQNNMCTTSMF